MRGPPVRMSPAQSRFEIKRRVETDVRAGPGAGSAEWRCVAAVKGEVMRAGGPRTQDFHSQNAIALGMVEIFDETILSFIDTYRK
jgi:hypothetical protein